MDGFFIAKFKKIDDGPKRNKEAIEERTNELKK